MALRKKKLIKPSLQLKLAGMFLCAAGLAVQVEAILLAATLRRAAEKLPYDGGTLLNEIPEIVRTNLLLTFVLLTPVMLGVGVAVTFRIAGPLYRFELYLKALRDGRQSEPCRLRKTDSLQDFCELLNEATAPLRRNAATSVAPATPALNDSPPAALPTVSPAPSESTTGKG
jgi:hypothetical protein